MTGTTTVVQKKKSLSSGKGGSGASVSVQETARPLLTPDECMRLPGIHPAQSAYWKRFGQVEPGEMLIFTAGHSPIRGRQLLHFIDPVFRERAALAPVVEDTIFQGGQQPEQPKAEAEPAAGSGESAAAAWLRYLDDLPKDSPEQRG